MKKPTIRVTKWLGDIPVEANCSACPGVVFRAKFQGIDLTAKSFRNLFRLGSASTVRQLTRKNNGRKRERSDISRAGVRNILKVASHACV